MRRGGDPAALRLQPEQPAAGAGDPDRAAAVAAQADRHHAAATAAAVPPLEPPGVRAVSQGLRVMPRDTDSV